VHRHAAARFRLRTAYLVLHFSDEALAGYRQPVADQGALIDLRVDHRRQTKLAGLAAVEEHVLGPSPAARPQARAAVLGHECRRPGPIRPIWQCSPAPSLPAGSIRR
jgi:hypothetical protein